MQRIQPSYSSEWCLKPTPLRCRAIYRSSYTIPGLSPPSSACYMTTGGVLFSVFYALPTDAYTKGMNSSFDLECKRVHVSCAVHFRRERCFVKKQLGYEMEKESPVALDSFIQDQQESKTSHRRRFEIRFKWGHESQSHSACWRLRGEQNLIGMEE